MAPDGVIRLAVFGMTGAGKTSFVNHATGVTFEVSDSGDSCELHYNCMFPGSRFIYSVLTATQGTRTIQQAETTIGDQRYILYDIPGYNDSNNEDGDLFVSMGRWLAVAHRNGCLLNGVVLMQCITDVRVADTEQARNKLFEKTVGPSMFKQVAIVSTMWNQVNPEFGLKNENNRLRGENAVWRKLIDGGATVLRYKHDEDSAKAVLRHFSVPGRFAPKTVQLQDELKKYRGRLPKTQAAIQLQANLGARIESLEGARTVLVGLDAVIIEESINSMKAMLEMLRNIDVSCTTTQMFYGCGQMFSC